MGSPHTVVERPSTPALDPARPKKTGKGLIILFFLVVFVLGGMLLAGYLPRRQRTTEIDAAAQAERTHVPEVTTVAVKLAPALNELELPGNITAVTESSINARADGYLRKRLVDIGDRVRAGQLLAVIEAPEVDQQLQQAKATLSQSRASLQQTEAALQQAQTNQRLAQVTLERWQTLVGRGVFSKQEGDEKQATYDARTADVQVAKANIEAARNVVAANEANVSRLTELQSYLQIKAPFAGIITARNTDVGSLISGNNNAAGRELFRMAQIDTVRIFINVPQSNVGSIRLGMPATVTVAQRGERFQGKVVRTSSSLDENTRTLLTEVQIPNPKGVLLPGMYAQVQLSAKTADRALLVPGDTLISNSNGSQVAVVENGKVHLQKVKLGRDYGSETEVLSGLQGTEKIIVNPSDDMQEGAQVKAVLRAPAPVRSAGSPATK